MGEIETHYKNAREFLEATRQAALDCECARRQLELMRSREGAKAQSYQPSVRGSRGADTDGMGAVVGRMDWERRIERRIERCYAMLDRATCVIYGPAQDGRGGLASIDGNAVADCVWWRYCAAERWEDVSAALGYTERQCQRMCERAIRVMDFFGIESVIEGWGR